MAEPLLVLRLEGPMQSWGERARWDIRDSLREPTKSGVVGLLGCAMGIGRSDVSRLRDLDRTLRMGVRVEQEGTSLDDYHTVTGRLPTAASKARRDDVTVVSRRRYLEDAAFLVMLAHRSDPTGEALAEYAGALRAPRWPLYLGRRSCVPTRPVLVELCNRFDSLEEGLERYPWSCLAACGVDRPSPRNDASSALLRVMIDDEHGALTRQDVIEVNDVRVYERRRVREYRVPILTQEVVA